MNKELRHVKDIELHHFQRKRINNILVVDDQIENLLIISRFLKSHSFNVFTAGNGREGLDIFTDNSALDLVIMDINMPVMDGCECCRAIRMTERGVSIPIIGISAQTNFSDKDIFDYFLRKPFRLDVLLELFSSCNDIPGK